MPKLDDTFLASRIDRQIERLEQGEELIARDVKSVLSNEALHWVDAEWQKQKQLRKDRTAQRGNNQEASGYRSKRDLYIEALKAERKVALKNELAAWKQKQMDSETRAARIYLEALFRGIDDGRDFHSATNYANNELTRAGFRRTDELYSRTKTRRDIEVERMEAEILNMGKTDEETEHEQILMRQEQLDQIVRRAPKSKSRAR